MLQHFKYYFIAVTISFLLIGCTDTKKQQTGVFSPTAFTIDTINFTRYEVNKNYHFFYSSYQQKHNHAPDKVAIKRWLNEYINDSYLLADAYRLHYNTDKAINAQTEAMAHLMISQPWGLLVKDKLQKNSTAEKLNQQDITRQVISQQNTYKTWIDSILRIGKLSLNRNTLNDFLLVLNNQPHKGLLILNNKTISDSVILNYTKNDVNRKVTVTQFCSFYNNLPLRKPVKNQNDVYSYLQSLVVDEYAFEEAEKRGITQSPQFILDKRNFKNSLIAAHYRQNRLKVDSSISSDEYAKFYRTHLNEFIEPQYIKATLYNFPDKNAAFKGFMTLKAAKGKLPKSAIIKKAQFKHNGTDRALMKILIKLKNGEPSMPMPDHNQFIIAVRDTSFGKYTPTLYDVITSIIPRIISQRQQKTTSQRTDSLKKTMRANGLQNLDKLLDLQGTSLLPNSNKPNINNL